MRDLDGYAPLHKAVLCNQEDSLLALLTSGADVSNMDGSGYTALHVRYHTLNNYVCPPPPAPPTTPNTAFLALKICGSHIGLEGTRNEATYVLI